MQIYRKRATGILIALCLFTLTGIMAMADGAAINLGPIKPANPGFGQSAQFSAFVTQKGRPVKNVRVEFWFSGRHGMRTDSWFLTTNSQGSATFTRTVPRDWITQDTWVDLNGSCDSVAAINLWRVRGKN